MESQERLKAVYGHVSQAEFEKLQAESGEVSSYYEMPKDLYESWEISLTGHALYISYGCRCQTCGFQYDFSHEEKVEIDDQ